MQGKREALGHTSYALLCEEVGRKSVGRPGTHPTQPHP
jgi:hypothetical protein